MDWTALSSRMALRMAALFSLCMALPLLLLALLLARGAATAGDQRLEERLGGVARSSADQLAGRLAAADAVAKTLTLRDVGELGSGIRPAALADGMFSAVNVVDRDGLLTSGGVALRPGPQQLASLERGRTGLLAVAAGEHASRVFLARAATASGSRRIVYFEIAPDWLWAGFDSASQSSALAVVDSTGRLLRGAPRAMTQGTQLGRILAAEPGRGADVQPVAWQAAGDEWHGTLARVATTGRSLAGDGWGVVAFDREPGFVAASAAVWTSLLLVLALALPAVLYAAARLAHRYLPAIESLRDAMPRLASRTFPHVTATADDEPAEMVAEFNQHVGRLHSRIEALETLGEIDRMLLQSADLEQVLGVILARVQQVTRCHSVAITLIDGDSPDLGRVYHVAEGRDDLPVSRICLDREMTAVLGQVRDGLTVARCEESRHSFLVPIRDLGAEVFWVWPVVSSDRLRAILAVGHREMPVVGTHVVQYGSEFASRLGIALSKTDREEELYRQAHFDPLTGLPNRLLFRDRLAQEVASATAGLGRGALLYIDLDHFKKVNDTLGHAAGDQLLTIVSQRLRGCVKDGDTVSRLGGDEFTVILRNVTDPDSVQGIATRIIDSLRMPAHIAGRDHFVGASIGATLFPDDGTVIEDLMRHADSAMYRAKSLGRGCIAFYDAAMAARVAPPSDTSLHRALRRREFSLFYQPQFSVATGDLGGVEALLRWQTPRDGMRNPGEFVPAAEESGFIVDIGGWVLEAACSQLARWREMSVAPPRLSLNVSPQQLRHPEFARLVKRSLEKYGLPPSILELELTETVLADEIAAPVLAQLSRLGVTLALDDFGTGYSSLSYLRQYPISVVKIDRSFLEDVPHDPAATTLVETIIVMAHTLGKKVVAEGIETLEQLDFLRERRCDLVQGFYLAKPMAAAAVTELLEGRRMRGAVPEARAAG